MQRVQTDRQKKTEKRTQVNNYIVIYLSGVKDESLFGKSSSLQNFQAAIWSAASPADLLRNFAPQWKTGHSRKQTIGEAMSSFRLSSQRKHSEHKAQVEPSSVCRAQNRWWETVNYLDSSFRGWATSSGPNHRPGEELRDSHRHHHHCKVS